MECCITVRPVDPPLGVTTEQGETSELCQAVEIRDDRHRVVATISVTDGTLHVDSASWANVAVVQR